MKMIVYDQLILNTGYEMHFRPKHMNDIPDHIMQEVTDVTEKLYISFSEITDKHDLSIILTSIAATISLMIMSLNCERMSDRLKFSEILCDLINKNILKSIEMSYLDNEE